MANPPPSEGIGDDFFEQIFAMPGYGGGGGGVGDHHGVLASGEGSLPGMMLQLSSGEGQVAGGGGVGGGSGGVGGGGGGFPAGMSMFPLGLSLEQGKAGGFGGPEEASGSGKRFRDDLPESGKAAPAKPERDSVPLGSLFPPFGHVSQTFHGHATPGTVAVMPQPPAPRPRVRARRGQATDPHSIAERLRRERIAERMRALQDLVPNSNKTDRAAMLDEIVEYVKFLRLQVKVLSMSRLGGTGAVAQLVADIPLPSVEGEAGEGGSNQQLWEKWSTDGTERQVAKLMEEDVGAAMQYLQSKALCIMPISLAATIYHTHTQPETSTLIKPEPNAPS